MPEIGVVHLVRKANGIPPFERFLASYRAQTAGLEHQLIVLFKGFGSADIPARYDELLEGVPHQRLHLPDRGFDLQPYFVAVRRYPCRYFCFLNSFSRIVAADWLSKLFTALSQPRVGLVGATGSYQSFARGHDERRAQLGRLEPAARLRARIRHVVSDRAPAMIAQRTAAWLFGSVGMWKPSRHFPPFPNYHIRTNAFMGAREVLLGIRMRPVLFKLSAFLLESGYESITRQVMRIGMRPVVVDRHGACFETERWHLANTFRQSRQEDLMVEDNQTEAYAAADPERRVWLSHTAWGEHARPG